MQLRMFLPTDIKALAQLWAADMGPEWPLSPQVAEQRIFCPRHFVSSDACIAMEGGLPVGVCVIRSIREPLCADGMQPEKGCIHLLVGTDTAAKRQLLDWGMDELISRGAKNISFGTDPFHLFPGIPEAHNDLQELLKTRRFKIEGAAWDMHCDIRNYTLPERVTAMLEARKDVSISPVQPHELEAMLEFFDREFGGRWKYEAMCRLQAEGNGDGILVARVGERIEGFCQIFNAQAKMVGSSQLWAGIHRNSFGGLGAIGCSRSVRGQGIGLALLCLGVEMLRQQGITEMCIDWTNLLDFYGKIGFKPWKRYIHASYHE